MLQDMNKVSSALAAVSLAASLGGCATVTRTPNTAWAVTTFPAGATVETSNGHVCQAPCEIGMLRRSTFTATITHPGYKPQTVAVSNRLSASGFAAFLGNGLFGGAPGAVVDIITGAPLDLYPSSSIVHLERDEDYYKKMYGYDYWAAPPSEFGMRPGDSAVITRF